MTNNIGIQGRGALIVIEGADRVGKTTHAAQLVTSLTDLGLAVQAIKFPDRTTSIGEVIDQYLKREIQLDDHAIHLLFSTNRWEWFPRMKSLLESGVSLVVDRYAYSGVAYSAAKESLSLDWCKHSDAGLLAADCVIYMTLSDEVTRTRPGYGDEIYEKSDFQTRVKKNYELLKDPSWIPLDASISSHELDKQLLDISSKTIQQVRDKPLSYLWR
jgi:dTMP kinase